jgi:hypothetical protein
MQVPGAEYIMNMTPLELNIERGHLIGDIEVEDRMYEGLKDTYRKMYGPAKRGISAPRSEAEMRDAFSWYLSEYRKLPGTHLEMEDQMMTVVGRRNVAQARLNLVDDLLRGRRNVRQRLG